MLSESDHSATLEIEVTAASEFRQEVMLKLTVLDNDVAVQRKELELELFQGNTRINTKLILEQPKLWWPNGYGEPPLYSLHAALISDKGELLYDSQVSFGIRSLSFLPNDEAEQNADSYTLCVNGKRIYGKGWNWVPMDVMYGVKRPEKLKHLLTLAKKANVNLLRIWGGGLIEREDI